MLSFPWNLFHYTGERPFFGLIHMMKMKILWGQKIEYSSE